MIVREERPADISAIRLLNREAFGSDVEGNLVDLLRRNGNVVLSMVAEEGDSIVGHILYSRVTISTGEGETRTALGLGPMAVLPSHHRRGVGKALVTASLDELRRRGDKLVVLVGHPEYYPKFGFRKGSDFRLRWDVECPGDAFMVLELIPGSAPPGGGVVRYGEEFSNV